MNVIGQNVLYHEMPRSQRQVEILVVQGENLLSGYKEILFSTVVKNQFSFHQGQI